MDYFICIGEIKNIETGISEPIYRFQINEDQKAVLDTFADTEKDEELNTVYLINKCRFTLVPKLLKDNSKIPKINNE